MAEVFADDDDEEVEEAGVVEKPFCRRERWNPNRVSGSVRALSDRDRTGIE